MNNIFISSRMKELAIERIVAFSTCKNLGFRPLMFETEPKDNLKNKIDKMLDVTDYFLGIYFETVGARDRDLYYLTPIEYELSYFFRKNCTNKNCRFFKNTDHNEESCLIHLRKILTAHYTNSNFYYECKSLIDKFKTRNNDNDRLHIFCKSFQDEHGMTPQLCYFLDGLSRLGITHIDYENEYDFANKFIDIIEDKNLLLNKVKKQKYYFEMTVPDKIGQSKALSDRIFFFHLNFDKLIITESKKNHAIFYACLSDYSNNNEKELKNIIERELRKYKLNNENLFVIKNKKDFIFNRITSRHIKKLNNIENKFKLFDNSHKNNKQKDFLIIRIYHLDVPGIFNNLCKVFSHDKHYRSEYDFSIERCILYKPRKREYFTQYKKIKDGEKTETKFNAWFIENIQITEFLLSIKKEKEYKLNNKGTILKLENTIFGVIGVKRVLISDITSIEYNKKNK
ncbi:MAG: DUF4062 domain-containing protein [bacterium]